MPYLSESGMLIHEPVPPQEEKVGLAFWMERVTKEWERARNELSPEVVHDLRVSLRRCRSMADGFMALDPHDAWKEMKQAGKALFRSLGDLRDAQVMMEWVTQLASDQDGASTVMTQHLSAEENRLKDNAIKALQAFSRKKWGSWSRLLSKRAEQVTLEGDVFQHMALEYWHQARALHRQALRNRSEPAFHRLRIGLKKFRYTVENFLPRRHAAWGDDLRELQDVLGEAHDLTILWRTAVKIGAFGSEETKCRWRSRIDEERRKRIDEYRRRMLGNASLWQVWRADLPSGNRFMDAAIARIQCWASFRDPDTAHSLHVAHLALQIYDGLNQEGLLEAHVAGDEARSILDLAGRLHQIGLSASAKKSHKSTYRMIRKLKPPLGWTKEILESAALVARYHRGALPHCERKRLKRLPEKQKEMVILEAGILRLAETLDMSHDQSIRKVKVKRIGDAAAIYAEGYRMEGVLAQKLAGARYLLESALGMPVIMRCLPPYPP